MKSRLIIDSIVEGAQPLPPSFYNCSPGECTPRTPTDVYLRNWRKDVGWNGDYPVNVIAQEMEFRPSGPSMSQGHRGQVLDTLGPFDDIESTRDAMEQLFRKHQATRGRVVIYPQPVATQ